MLYAFFIFLCGFGLTIWWVVLGYVGVTMCWWWRGGYGGDCVLNFLVLFVVASARG